MKWLLSALVMGAISLTASHSAQGQTSAAAKAAVPKSEQGTSDSLHSDARLNIIITFQQKRVTLQTLLASLSKKAKLELTIADAEYEMQELGCDFRRQTLRSVMKGIALAGNAEWQQEKNEQGAVSWQLVSKQPKVVDGTAYDKHIQALAANVMDQLSKQSAALRGGIFYDTEYGVPFTDGVPFNQLPASVQNSLQQMIAAKSGQEKGSQLPSSGLQDFGVKIQFKPSQNGNRERSAVLDIVQLPDTARPDQIQTRQITVDGKEQTMRYFQPPSDRFDFKYQGDVKELRKAIPSPKRPDSKADPAQSKQEQAQREEWLKRPVTLSLGNDSLTYALSLLAPQATVSYVYDLARIPETPERATAKWTNRPLRNVLDELAAKYTMTWELSEGNIVVLKITSLLPPSKPAASTPQKGQ